MNEKLKAAFYTLVIMIVLASFVYLSIVMPMVFFYIIVVPTFVYVAYSVYNLILLEIKNKK